MIPIFKGTEEAITFGAKMSAREAEYLTVRREGLLEAGKILIRERANQAALNVFCYAQFDREAVETFNNNQGVKS